MQIQHRNLVFELDNSISHQLTVNIKPIDDPYEILWDCTLEGLWKDEMERPSDDLERVWQMHEEGDFFQQTIYRHNNELHKGISYTALFHEMIRDNRLQLEFIRNVFSTSRLAWLSMGYAVSEDSLDFWRRQEAAGLAEFIVEEQRYKALL